MAREPMTLEEIRVTRPEVDRAKVTATTEEDIRRHQVEDGEDPDAPCRRSGRRRTCVRSGRSLA